MPRIESRAQPGPLELIRGPVKVHDGIEGQQYRDTTVAGGACIGPVDTLTSYADGGRPVWLLGSRTVGVSPWGDPRVRSSFRNRRSK
jgi:hypothetical protein